MEGLKLGNLGKFEGIGEGQSERVKISELVNLEKQMEDDMVSIPNG